MPSNKIVLPSGTFVDKDIMSGRIKSQNSIPCDELTVDTMTATIDGSVEAGFIFTPKGSSGLLTKELRDYYVGPKYRLLVHDLSVYTYGDPVDYYRDNVRFSRFYMSSARRVSKYKYEIECVSAIGLLDNETHYGGIYQGVPAGTILSSIIGGVIPYTVDSLIANISVFGWLPIATRRQNLHQLLFAIGGTVRKDSSGNMVFTYIKSGTATEIEDDRIFIGGSVNYDTPIMTAKVLEHSYTAYGLQETESLYEDSVPAKTMTTPLGKIVSGALVQFKEPMFDITIEDGTILESGVNYAVLKSGMLCKLFGKRYTHTTRENIATKPAFRGVVSVVDNTATVDNATLVSLANGENVANRVLSYYGYTKTVSANIEVKNERPGDIVTFNDPYGEESNGFVESMDIAMSGTLKASAKLVSGFVPTNPGNFYNNSVVLTGSGTFTIPSGVKKIKVAILGGGTGGFSGKMGEYGKQGAQYTITTSKDWVERGYQNGAAGVGGDFGIGGGAGKILEAEINVSPGTGMSYRCGIGGVGGDESSSAESQNSGASGTASVFSGYSSDNGAVSLQGYVDVFTGKVYAKPGGKGKPGGNGSGAAESNNSTIVPGNDIIDENGTRWIPGNSERRLISAGSKYLGCGAIGGSGGGASIGGNGIDGLVGRASTGGGGSPDSPTRLYCTGGTGGSGSTPVKRGKSKTLASGGDGGHGGGGGGGAGINGCYYNFRGSTTPPPIPIMQYNPGAGGTGGKGGAGGQGGDGCIIVYF